MRCRYCGKDIKAMGSNLISDYGQNCAPSPTKKHVAVSDGVACVYCGRETKTMGTTLITSYGNRCSASPTGAHALQ